MRVAHAFRTLIIFVFSSSILGCASAQLNFNSVDLATSFTDLYARQVLTNLSTYIDEPYAVPSQTDITAGTVQTSSTVTPSFTYPLSRSTTTSGLGATTSRVIAGSGLSVSAADSWQQNWNILPISDSNILRNLRAIYRHAVFGSDLTQEYHVPKTSVNGKFVEDPYWLQLPQCVVCDQRVKGKTIRIVNPLLKPAWLRWDGGLGFPGRQFTSPSGEAMIDLGHYGNHELSMLRQDFDNGVFANFLLFVLPNAEPAEASAKPGASGPRAPASPSRPSGAPAVPQIIPAPPP
jgi:hypothetical protein